MDPKRDVDPDVHLDEILTTLDAALAVDPSPGFQARVRQRVAAERVAPGWYGLRWALAGTAALLVLTAGVWWSAVRDQRASPAPLTTTTAPPPPMTAATAAEPVLSSPAGLPAADPALARAVAMIAGSEPPVLVPPAELAAVRRLVAVARAGRFTYVLAAEAEPVAGEVAVSDPITIAPIVVAPVDTSME